MSRQSYGDLNYSLFVKNFIPKTSSYVYIFYIYLKYKFSTPQVAKGNENEIKVTIRKSHFVL